MYHKEIECDSQLHLGIPFFGRLEHGQFILRVWFLHDIRYACPSLSFRPSDRKSIEVVWFHSNRTEIRQWNELRKCQHPSLKQFAAKATWRSSINSSTFKTPSDPSLFQQYNLSSPFQYFHFANPETRIELPPPTPSSQTSSPGICNLCHKILIPTHPDGELANNILHQYDNSISTETSTPFLTPIFELPNVFTNPSINQKFRSSPAHRSYFKGAIKTRLTLIPINPTEESPSVLPINIEPYLSNIYPVPYLPCSLQVVSILRSWNLLNGIHSCPFIIVAIDLCDQSSIELAIWAYHTLLYLYNYAAPFPERHTKVLIMVFNSMSLDSQIISLETVQKWFDIDAFPLPIEYYLYPDLFVLPPQTPKETKNYDYNHHISNTSSSSTQQLSQFQLQQVETVHKSLALYLDKLYTSQVEASCLSYITQESTSLNLPFAFHQMKRLSPPPFPLPRFIPSKILLPLRSQTHFLPNGTPISIKHPLSMPHWCNFDTYDFNQQLISFLSPSTTSSNHTHTASSNDDHQHELLEHCQSQNQPKSLEHQNQNLHKSLEHRQNQHFSNHICKQYEISMFSFPDYNFEVLSRKFPWHIHQNDPTPLTILFSELSSMKFDLLCMPFSSPLNPTPLSPSHSYITMQDTNETTTTTTLSSIKTTQIPEPDFTIHYVRQVPKCNPLEQDSFAIEHFSTCPIQAIFQSNTSLSFSTSPSTQSTSPLMFPTSTTTIYQSETRPERYYSMMNVDDVMKEKLYHNSIADAEQQLQQKQKQQQEPHQQQSGETLLSPFLSILANFPDHSTNTIAQLFTPSTPHSEIHSEQPLAFLSPLSSKLHHAHLNTCTQGYFFLQTYTSLPMATLFACSLFPLSAVYRYVQIIEHVRRIHYTPSILQRLCLWKNQIQHHKDFKFTVHHFLNNSPFQLKSDQLEQALLVPLPESTSSTTSFQHTSATTTKILFPQTTSQLLPFSPKREHFIYRCLTNVPTLEHPTCQAGYRAYRDKSKDQTYLSEPSSSLYKFMNASISCGYQLTPHFLMIIDDSEHDPELYHLQHDQNYTFCDHNRPAYLTKNAALVNSFLTFFTNRLEISKDRHIATHYSFVSPSQAKQALLEFSRMSLAMRMDCYNEF